MVYNLFQQYFKQKWSRCQDKKNKLVSWLSLNSIFYWERVQCWRFSTAPWRRRRRKKETRNGEWSETEWIKLHPSPLTWGQTRSLTQQTGCDRRGGEIISVCVFRCRQRQTITRAKPRARKNQTELSWAGLSWDCLRKQRWDNAGSSQPPQIDGISLSFIFSDLQLSSRGQTTLRHFILLTEQFCS